MDFNPGHDHIREAPNSVVDGGRAIDHGRWTRHQTLVLALASARSKRRRACESSAARHAD